MTTLRISENAYACSVTGELDVFTVDSLCDELAAVAARGGRLVLVDLVSVTFIDSAGLGLLLAEAARRRSEGGELLVVSDDPRTLRLFDVTGSGRQFRVERSLANAVEDVAQKLLT